MLGCSNAKFTEYASLLSAVIAARSLHETVSNHKIHQTIQPTHPPRKHNAMWWSTRGIKRTETGVLVT